MFPTAARIDFTALDWRGAMPRKVLLVLVPNAVPCRAVGMLFTRRASSKISS
jgi:hypothetical protein